MQVGTTKQQVLWQLLAQQQEWVSGDDLGQALGLSRASIWKAITALRNQGHRIASRKSQGYQYQGIDRLDQDVVDFDTQHQFQNRLQIFDQVTSTQSLAKEFLSTHQVLQPTIFAAEEQSQAYGRRGRAFYAPAKTGLYCSLILPNPTNDWPSAGLLTTSIAVLIARVLEEFFPQEKIKLKWVNDLYVGQRKVGGILTEAVLDLESSSTAAFVIGFGLNLTTANFPQDLMTKVRGIDPSGKIDRNLLLAHLIEVLINNYLRLADAQLLDEYRQRSLLLNKEVSLQLGSQMASGVVQGIDDQGGLIIKNKAGQVRTFTSGEVTKVHWQ
ncbi:biotin--[acetyl-CoA-carboxylase] ligase [Lactobacillus sp. DCY120]|uniref:Bifunctional ligase/repressor BirA n=1 Tax=Bombilactobacillus apium TaxID=2675299 RepID=A0A850R8A1_9LACO|nr:biotin--[acetyl-CoA-carboxylase] ligase [Bombilactobacillus apium]NVY96942.1 biotin--[acetyl-CoA-carboxylase] ligase [Bombilactobacillus apium]